jgi:hypothetical protein
MTGTRTHLTWRQMLNRCNNPMHVRFNAYGRRGITVCKRWMKFENFHRDMGDKPVGGSIHRINNDEGYYPDNCVWLDWREHDRLHRREKSNDRG